MTSDESLRVVAETLAESVLLVGVGAAGEAAAERVAEGDAPATDDASDPDVVVLAVDGPMSGESDLPDADGIADAPLSVAVVALPARPSPGERDFRSRLAERTDAVVFTAAADGSPDPDVDALAEAVETFVSVVRDPGFVNLDLADARTVLESVDAAALGVGESDRGSPSAAVADAFASLPTGIQTDPASGVLVDLLGGPGMTVGDVSDAVSAVRARVGPDAHVIWGGAVDEALDEAVRVRLVVAGVADSRRAPGDPCPRCESTLSTYALNGRRTLSCDDCGYAGVSVRLRE